MPFIIDHTVNSTNYPDSWWLLGALNVDFPNKTATLIMRGYSDRAAYDADSTATIEIILLSFTNPDVFDAVFSELGYVDIETMLWIGTGGFPEEGTPPFENGTLYSRIDFDSGFIGFNPITGPNGNTKFYAIFTDNLDGSDFLTGTTISVNGTPATISSAVLQPNTKIVLYTLSAPVANSDTLTFEYDGSAGFTGLDSGLLVALLPEKLGTNLLGTGAVFNVTNNSSHIATLL